MSREIKFRAWDKLEKRMGEVSCIKFRNVQYSQVFVRFKQLGKIVDEWFNYDEGSCNNVILMQYTGLKDKNGKEIYEGDIVKIAGRYFKDSKVEHNFKVEYDESRAWFGVLDALHTVSLNDFDYEEDLEVIGNIYENPELLEVQ